MLAGALVFLHLVESRCLRARPSPPRRPVPQVTNSADEATHAVVGCRTADREARREGASRRTSHPVGIAQPLLYVRFYVDTLKVQSSILFKLLKQPYSGCLGFPFQLVRVLLNKQSEWSALDAGSRLCETPRVCALPPSRSTRLENARRPSVLPPPARRLPGRVRGRASAQDRERGGA